MPRGAVWVGMCLTTYSADLPGVIGDDALAFVRGGVLEQGDQLVQVHHRHAVGAAAGDQRVAGRPG